MDHLITKTWRGIDGLHEVKIGPFDSGFFQELAAGRLEDLLTGLHFSCRDLKDRLADCGAKLANEDHPPIVRHRENGDSLTEANNLEGSTLPGLPWTMDFQQVHPNPSSLPNPHNPSHD
jgi:hypothetical protein